MQHQWMTPLQRLTRQQQQRQWSDWCWSVAPEEGKVRKRRGRQEECTTLQ